MAKNNKEILEIIDRGNWQDNKSLWQMYEFLSQEMPDDKRKARMDEIKEAIQSLQDEVYKRQRVALKQSKNKGAVNQDNNNKLEELNKQIELLEDEMETLDYFPGVKYIIGKIDETKKQLTEMKEKRLARADRKLTMQNNKLKDITAKKDKAEKAAAEAKASVEEADKKAEEAKKSLERIQQIEKEIVELTDEMATVKKRPKIYAAYEAEIAELVEEKKALGKKEDLEKIINGAAEAKSSAEEAKKKAEETKRDLAEAMKNKEKAEKEKVRVETGNNPLNKEIAKCENPWNEILKGYSWEAIATMKDDELSKLVKVPEDKGKDEEGEAGRGGGNGGLPPNPQGPTLGGDEGIKPDEEHPEGEKPPRIEEPPAKRGFFRRFMGWIENIREDMRYNREYKRAEREAAKSNGTAKLGLFGRIRNLLRRNKPLAPDKIEKWTSLAEKYPEEVLGEDGEEKITPTMRPTIEPKEDTSLDIRRQTIINAKVNLDELNRFGEQWIKEGIITEDEYKVLREKVERKYLPVRELAAKYGEKTVTSNARKAHAEFQKELGEGVIVTPFTGDLASKPIGEVVRQIQEEQEDIK